MIHILFFKMCINAEILYLRLTTVGNVLLAEFNGSPKFSTIRKFGCQLIFYLYSERLKYMITCTNTNLFIIVNQFTRC